MGFGQSKANDYLLKFKDDNKNTDIQVNGSERINNNSNASSPLKRAESANVKRNDRKIQPLSKQHSTSAATGLKQRSASVTPTSISADRVQQCSLQYPWLLKNTKFNSTVSINEFELGKVIGKGLMGVVRIAKTKDKKYFVIKSIRKDYIIRHHDQRHVQSEREVLQTVSNCSFCIKLFGHCQDKYNIHFLMEFSPGGELFHRLGKKRSFPPDVAKFYICEILVALDHVQSNGFVYRDLKPENIILDEVGHCKLVDFGFTVRPDPDGRMRTLCGTPAYLSPEQLDGKLTNGYTKVVDWWSFGVLLYELRTGNTPFCSNPRDSHYEIFLRILNSKISYPMSFDSKSKELISALCHSQINKRLCEPDEIKNHGYFGQGFDWKAVSKRKLIPPFIPKIKEEGDCHYFDIYNDTPITSTEADGGGKKLSFDDNYIDF